MFKILRHWTRLGRNARAAFFRVVADNLAKTPSPLASPNPPLATYEAKVALAEEKLGLVTQLEQDLKAARIAAQAAVDDVADATELMARRTEDTHGADAAAMVAVGFQVVGQPVAVGALTPPEDFEVTAGDDDGELDWQCQPVRGGEGYETRTTPTPTDAASWQVHTVVTRSKGTITGLPSGVRQYVAVRAIGPNGPGPWSDVASRMVP